MTSLMRSLSDNFQQNLNAQKFVFVAGHDPIAEVNGIKQWNMMIERFGYKIRKPTPILKII